MVRCSLSLVICCVFVIGLIILIIPYIFSSIPTYNEHACVGGMFLRDKEQMWCTPKSKSDVTVSGKCSFLSLFRLKKSQLPKKIIRSTSYVKTDIVIAKKSSVSHSFEMMPGSNVSGTIGSSDRSDDCYFMTIDNFNSFLNKNDFTPIQSGKGSLSTTFAVTEGNEFVFVINHPGSESVGGFINLTLNYAVYDTSSLNPLNCKYDVDDQQCDLEDVTSNEVIVAEYGDNSVCQVQLLLPDTLGAGAVLSYIIAPIIMIGSGLTLCIVGIVNSVQAKKQGQMLNDVIDVIEKLNQTDAQREQESTHLMNGSRNSPSYY